MRTFRPDEVVRPRARAKWRFVKVVASVVVFVVLPLSVFGVARTARHDLDAATRALDSRSERAVTELLARRWNRGSAVGAHRHGDATQARLDALTAIDWPRGIALVGDTQLAAGELPSEATRARLRPLTPAIATLRAATEFDTVRPAWDPRPEGGPARMVFARASSALDLDALASSPDDCLEKELVIIRLAFDTAFGEGPLGLAAAAVAVDNAAQSAIDCSLSASPAATERAELYLAALTADPPPYPLAFEAMLHGHDALIARSVRHAVGQPTLIDFAKDIASAFGSRDFLVTRGNVARLIPRLRGLPAVPTPAQRLQIETAYRQAHVGHALDDVTSRLRDVDRLLRVLARARACLCALRVVRVIGDAVVVPEEVSRLLVGTGSADPYTGRTMRWIHDAARGVGLVYSVGADGHDDRDRTDTDDVSVRVELSRRRPRGT